MHLEHVFVINCDTLLQLDVIAITVFKQAQTGL